MSDPLGGPKARFVSGPTVDAPPELSDVVWFEIDELNIGLRPIHQTDKDALLEGFVGMSERSRYQRFLAPMDRLSDRQAAYLTDVDQVNHFAWVAGRLADDGSLQGIGVARYVRDTDDPTMAELAVAVADEGQARGIGTLLVEALVVVADRRRVQRIFGLLLADNEPMRRIFKSLGATIERQDGAVLRAEVDLPAKVALTRDGIDALVEVADAAAEARR